jgi:hypothetical protein
MESSRDIDAVETDPPPLNLNLQISGSDAFDYIQHAKQAGVPIVPLVGAGLSAESGIPTTSQLIDYFSHVKASIDIKYRRKQMRQARVSRAPLDHDLPSSVYHDYLLKAGWPDPNQLNVELLVEYRRALKSKKKSPTWERADTFRKSFVVPAGNTLSGVRLWAIHGRLRNDQPAFMDLFSAQVTQGKCPVGNSVESMSLSFQNALEVFINHALDQKLEQEGIDTSLPEIGIVKKLLGDPKAADGLVSAVSASMRDLRTRALRKLGVDWRGLMRTLTLGSPALSDSLFDLLVRRGDPSPGHQLLALLTESLGWNLWLTTNFDTLIEQGLRAQGIDPIVFEIHENGPAPDATLFRNRPSVVKLHGGSFALRVDESLDVPLDKGNLDRFVEYFPKDALVLVLGYGGGDRRVMSLIDHLARRHRNDQLPKILWVARDGVPRSVSEAARLSWPWHPIKVVEYRSGGLFLRDLHSRLVRMHPASRTSYPALPMVPPYRCSRPDSDRNADSHPATATQDGRADALDERVGQELARTVLLNKSVVVFTRRLTGESLMAHVSEYVRLSSGYNEIWCELADVATVRAMIALFFDQFRRYDPDITPKALELHTLGDSPAAGAREFGDREEENARFFAGQFAAAMRRGKYLVAITSTGELGRHPFAHDLDDDEFEQSGSHALNQTRLFYAFLRELIKNEECLGDSKLCVALTPLEASATRRKAIRLFEAFEAELKEWQPQVIVEIPGGKREGAPPEQMLQGFLDQMNHRALTLEKIPAREYGSLLVIAATFRRPRSLINLRRVAQQFGVLGWKVDREEWGQDPLSDDKWNHCFDVMLRNLDQFGLLFRVQGGFLWMPTAVRDFLYRHRRQPWLDSGLGARIAELHESIADEYSDLLRQSNSLPALAEAAYHLIAAMRLSGEVADQDVRKHGALRKLGALLERSRAILRTGPPYRVAAWALALQEQIPTLKLSPDASGDDLQRFNAAKRDLAHDLRELRAVALYRAGQYAASSKVREMQIKRLEKADSRHPVRTRLWLARFLLEQGRCLARLLPDLKAREAIFESAKQNALDVYRSLRSTGSRSRHARRLREPHRIRIECLLERAQLHLGEVHTWEWTRRPPEGKVRPEADLKRIRSARRRCKAAQKLLERTSELFSHDFTHLHVMQCLAWARLNMLEGDFLDAIHWLDNAQAAAARRVGDGWEDLADIRLQAAENLILRAGFNADATESPGETRKSEVKDELDRANVALEQARTALLSCRLDGWRWARLGLVRAYLQYELLLSEAWVERPDQPQQREPEDSSAGKTARQEARNQPPLDSRADTLIKHGLIALGGVVELCWPDPVRKDEIILLWLRFLIAFAYFRQVDDTPGGFDDQVDDWLRWNENAGLSRFAAHQHVERLCRESLESFPCGPVSPAGEKRRTELIEREKLLEARFLYDLHTLLEEPAHAPGQP